MSASKLAILCNGIILIVSALLAFYLTSRMCLADGVHGG